MYKTFYTVADGKIDYIQQGDTPAGEQDWKEAPNDWGGNHGDKLEWFDENMRRIPDPVLVEQGKLMDKRGVWYNKITRERTSIDNYDVDIGAEWTREEPLPNEPFQKWDEGEGWIVDTEKKERAEKEFSLANIQAQIDDAERKIIRPLRAISRGRATKNDTDKFNELDALIENELRPELDRLARELKSA